MGEKKVVKNSKKLDSVKDLRRNPMVISAKFLQFLKKKSLKKYNFAKWCVPGKIELPLPEIRIH